MRIFNLLASNITNLDLKLDGKLPIDRDELIALVNSWGRFSWFYSFDKNSNEIEIEVCKDEEKYDLSKLDVSNITNFDDIFKYSYFDGNINNWNVSNSTSMEDMFYKNKNFNSPLDKWDVSNVTNMNSMFGYAIKFNQNINSWNVLKVEKMCFMFSDTKEFNQPLDNWNTSNVTSLAGIFYKAKKFNQAILWDLSKVESYIGMFYETKAFEERFNNGNPLPYYTNEVENWLIDNKSLMDAIYIEDNRRKELDDFLSLTINKDNSLL